MLDPATRARLAHRLECMRRWPDRDTEHVVEADDLAAILAAYDRQAPIVAAAVAYVEYGLGHSLLVGCGGGKSYWEALKAAVRAAGAVGAGEPTDG